MIDILNKRLGLASKLASSRFTERIRAIFTYGHLQNHLAAVFGTLLIWQATDSTISFLLFLSAEGFYLAKEWSLKVQELSIIRYMVEGKESILCAEGMKIQRR